MHLYHYDLIWTDYELSETTQERCFYFKQHIPISKYHFKKRDSGLGWNLLLVVKGLIEPWVNKASHWKWTHEDWESDAPGKLSFQ